jgi:8-oxo-dGTP pyrophosphatase MutT (NUDIX family)
VLAAAIREAKEEVGIDIVKQEIIGKKICGATIERDLRYVLVSEFTYSKDGLELEEGELIE